MLPALRIRVLGGFDARYGETSVAALSTGRLQALVTYLLLHGDTSQPRQHLAFQFWPDAPETNARNNLRQLLFHLRLALPDAERFLAISGASVAWRRDEAQVIDAHQVEQAWAAALAAEQTGDERALQQRLDDMIAAYHGDLLPACYDDWIRPDRERLHNLALTAYEKLLRLLEAQQNDEAALHTAHAMLRLDPLHAQTYLHLLRLHTSLRDPTGARRVYETAVDTFRRELGVEPGEALREAFERSQRLALTAPPTVRSVARTAHTAIVIGRQAEQEQMRRAWQRATAGASGMLLLTGEAGIGKSHLAERLYHQAQQQDSSAASARCYEAEGRLSFAPVVEWLRSPALRPHLATLDHVWLTEIARLLPEMLVEYPDLPAPESIGEYGQRQRFFEAMARAVLVIPLPLLLWIDDLQWCDSETLEWLHYLLRSRPDAALLILGTARSGELTRQHPLATIAQQLRIEDRLTLIELGPLDAAETARLAGVIRGAELDAPAALSLFRETEGNPLFVVETVQAGLIGAATAEAASGPDAPNRGDAPIPPRLYAILARRLAQLSPPARRVAELGACVGRAFAWELLTQALAEDDAELTHSLDELWQKRILREVSANSYDFSHDKLLEVTYAEISVPQRRLLHRHIAQSLEALHAASLDPVSAQIAAQYELAGAPSKAVPYYQRAGLVAARVYANNDAIAWLQRALALLADLPATTKRDSTELALQFALARLYRIAKGWAAPEVERVVDRTLVLSEKVGDALQRAEALYGAQTVYVVAGQLDKVENTYRQMYQLHMDAQGQPPPRFAGMMYAGAKLHMGQAVEAREVFEQMLAVVDERQVLDLETSQGINYLVHGHAWHAHALWYLGQPRAALEHAARAVALAEQFRQPFNQALAVTYQAMLLEMQAGFEQFQVYAGEAVRLTKTYEAPYYHAWANILAAFAEAWPEPDEASLQQLRRTIDTFTATGAHLRLPYYLSLLARAYQRADRWAEGMAALEEAMRESRQNNERWWAPELHRLRGDLLLAQGAAVIDVEVAYKRALDLARAQQATPLELRAATSLARLWAALGQPDDIERLLAPVYQRLADAPDCPDIRAARAVLEHMPR